jgi:hypothetical protein
MSPLDPKLPDGNGCYRVDQRKQQPQKRRLCRMCFNFLSEPDYDERDECEAGGQRRCNNTH